MLAAAIARQAAVRERFPGGIFWIAVEQTPQLVFLQAQLCRALGHAEVFDSIGEGTRRLRDALPPAGAEVARACGYLPLALAMIGALVRRGRSWAEMQTWLDEAQLVRIQGNVPAVP